jgi:hypothetical protein
MTNLEMYLIAIAFSGTLLVTLGILRGGLSEVLDDN